MTAQQTKRSALAPRVVTGAFLLVLLLATWYIGGVAVLALAVLVVALAQWEFFGMFLPYGYSNRPKIMGVAVSALFLTLTFFLDYMPTQRGARLIMTLLPLCLPFLLAAYALAGWNSERARRRLFEIAILLGGFIYITLLTVPVLSYIRPEQLLIIAVPVFSDITAYFVGTKFGRHKIWPSVSPKKSVEGAIAGLGGAVLASTGVAVITGAHDLIWFVPMGIFLGVMSQFGDFFESALKRTVGIKDSGVLLPGHGGVLDRIDSWLFSCGAYAIFCFFTPPLWS